MQFMLSAFCHAGSYVLLSRIPMKTMVNYGNRGIRGLCSWSHWCLVICTDCFCVYSITKNTAFHSNFLRDLRVHNCSKVVWAHGCKMRAHKQDTWKCSVHSLTIPLSCKYWCMHPPMYFTVYTRSLAQIQTLIQTRANKESMKIWK